MRRKVSYTADNIALAHHLQRRAAEEKRIYRLHAHDPRRGFPGLFENGPQRRVHVFNTKLTRVRLVAIPD